MGRVVAAFDFDGTLTRRDTVLPFLVFACGRRKVSSALGRATAMSGRTRVTRRPDDGAHHRDALKQLLLRDLFAGTDPAHLADRGAVYARSLPGRLRASTVDRVERHRAAGHELVIVSASLSAYLDPFGTVERFDHVIGVELATGADGLLTGALLRPNVRGPEKVTRLREWLAGSEPDELWAYGNSSGDKDLLAMATHPVWVRRNPRFGSVRGARAPRNDPNS